MTVATGATSPELTDRDSTSTVTPSAAPAPEASPGPTVIPSVAAPVHRPEPRSPEEAREALEQLAAAAREEMDVLGHNHDWVPEPAPGAYNVLIIGGGQAGLGAAFALQRHRIGGVKVIEAGPPESIGCWDRFARMHTLRSPKNMKGIELDIPSLHTRRWFEAKYGPAAWEVTNLVPRLDWHEYLAWYREVTGADVDFRTRVVDVQPPQDADGYFTVTARRTAMGAAALTGTAPQEPGAASATGATADGETVTYRARRIIFALGLIGGGGTFLPPAVQSLPASVRAHTEDAIDFPALAGKKVVVLGGGASGFDNAAAALEAGAGEVEMHVRRSDIPRQNSLRWMEFPGMQEHFYDLSDEDKWQFSLFNGGLPQPPTQASVWRAFAQPNFRMCTDTRWASAEFVDAPGAKPVRITTEDGRVVDADFVISATGYVVDLSLRPELREFLPDIALWSHRFPGAGEHPLGKCPYLGQGFQFQATEDADEAAQEYIPRLFHLSTGARASHGVAGNQLSGIYAGLTRIANQIARDITRENWPRLFGEFQAFEYQEVGSVGPHRPESDDPYPQGPRY